MTLKKPAGVLKAKAVVTEGASSSKFDKALSRASTGDAKPRTAPNRTQTLMKAAHDTISSIPYTAAPAVGVQLHPAALSSVDKDGFPSTRTVIPNFVAQDLSEVRLSTRKGTRKLAEIEANPKVSLHFQDQRGRGGWVTIKGEVTTKPGSEEDVVDIVLTPRRCEAMSYVEDAMADEEGWKPAIMVKPRGEAWRRTE